MRPFLRVVRLLAVACLVAGCGAGSPAGPTTLADPGGYLTAMMNVMEANSINRHTIDWTAFRSQVLAAGNGATSLTLLAPAIGIALGLLGDHHSFFESASGLFVYNPSSPRCMAPAFSKTPKLPSTIGYVYAGTCSSCDRQTYAAQIQAQIRSVDSGALTGWIVDLRTNTGGDYVPMVTGLGPILGDGLDGYFIDADGGATSWAYNQGVMTQNTAVVMTLAQPYALTTPNPRVAVLTDNLTTSSGEATLVSFLGRPNTRTFGNATCGLSSANTGYRLADGSTIILTVGIDADRTQRLYGGPIVPDVVVNGADQAVVDAAASWLTSTASNDRIR
jgi:carboxyl-terminal processing protease